MYLQEDIHALRIKGPFLAVISPLFFLPSSLLSLQGMSLLFIQSVIVLCLAFYSFGSYIVKGWRFIWSGGKPEYMSYIVIQVLVLLSSIIVLWEKFYVFITIQQKFAVCALWTLEILVLEVKIPFIRIIRSHVLCCWIEMFTCV